MRIRTFIFGGALLLAALLALVFGGKSLLVANVAYVAALVSVIFVVADDLIDRLFPERCADKPDSVRA